MYSDEQRETLLSLARASIEHGLSHGNALSVTPEDYPEALRQQRACFVTLNLNHNLRGCIGHLEPMQTLVEDVSENAFSAAFRDPRFPPLSEAELTDLELHISVLSIPQPLPVSSQQDLMQKLRPGIDGVILQDGANRGTFLPSVWDQLPIAEDFVRHLKMKAGLPPNHWSDSIRVFTYQAESIE